MAFKPYTFLGYFRSPVAYVFLHVLPELSRHRRTFAESLGVGEERAEVWVYLVALLGLSAFYGLERIAKVVLVAKLLGGERPMPDSAFKKVLASLNGNL